LEIERLKAKRELKSVRVATHPDFSVTSRFPAWMSRVPARPRSGRLCPAFCIKIKVCEKGLYIRRTISCYCTVCNSANVFWAVRLVLAFPFTHNTVYSAFFCLTVSLNVSIFCLSGLLCRLLLSACTHQQFFNQKHCFSCV